MQEVCKEKGIRLLDVTGPLKQLNQTELLSHNLVFDTHLTADGAEVVAQALADTLRSDEVD